MVPEDRVIVTDSLVAVAQDPDGNRGSLVVSSALLDRLDPTGVHVVVPSARTQIEDEPTLICHLVLAVRDQPEPVRVVAVITVDQYERLMTAFDALRVASALIPSTAAAIWSTDGEMAKRATRPLEPPDPGLPNTESDGAPPADPQALGGGGPNDG